MPGNISQDNWLYERYKWYGPHCSTINSDSLSMPCFDFSIPFHAWLKRFDLWGARCGLVIFTWWFPAQELRARGPGWCPLLLCNLCIFFKFYSIRSGLTGLVWKCLKVVFLFGGFMYFPLVRVALARAMISHSSTSLRAGHNFSCAIYTTCGSRRSVFFMFCTLNLYLHIEFTCKLEVVPVTIQEIHMDRDWSWWRCDFHVQFGRCKVT